MTDAGYSLKVSFKDQNRRFLLSELDYDNLLLVAAERFGCTDTSALYFQHQDPDGDLVTISSSDELAEATRLTPAGATLRLVLSERSAAKEADTSPKESASIEPVVPAAVTYEDLQKAVKEKEKEKKKQRDEEKKEKKEKKAEKEKDKIAKIVAEILQAQGISPSPSPAPSVVAAAAAGEQDRNLLNYRSPELDAPEATPAPETAAPTEEHLRALVDAAIAGLELDRTRVYARLEALSPADLQAQLAALPPIVKMGAQHFFSDPADPSSAPRAFPFPFPFAAFPGAFPPPCGGPPPPPPHAHGPPPHAGPGGWMSPGGWRRAHHHHGPHHGHRDHHGPHHGHHHGGRKGEALRGPAVPAVPTKMLTLEASGPEVEALHKNLAYVGYLQVRPKFWACKAGLYTRRTVEAVSSFQRDHGITPVEAGVFDADTRDSLASKVEARRAAEAKEPEAEQDKPKEEPKEEPKEDPKEEEEEEEEEEYSVELTDTDGDVMLFMLVEERLSEFVNGELELESVAEVAMDARAGTVVDAKGRFTVIPEHRARLAQLRRLLTRVGARVVELAARPQERTVVVDVDLSAGAEAQAENQGRAEAAVRSACEAMGVDAGSALQRLQRLFDAAPGYAAELAGEEAGQAVAAGLARAGEEMARARDVIQAELKEVYDECQKEAAAATAETAQEEEEQETFTAKSSVSEDDDFVDVAEAEEKEEEKAGEESEEEAVWGSHETAVVQLMSMGFAPEGPTPELIALLEECAGDVNRVVERLLARV